jgi:hypothetical protein
MPKIEFLYPPPVGTVFDRNCGTADAPDIQETVRRRPEFQRQWDQEGPAYLRAAIAEVGRPFPYAEMQATMTVCRGTSTMSMPLMINMRQFLSSAKSQPPHDDFVEKVFHELMHHYVSPVMRNSALRKKYANESPVVFAHLHVMALEKFVLEKLRKFEELKFLEQEYLTDPPPSHYKRAWEIMNAEGERAFIQELRDTRDRPR